ncbi:hypothetical protein RRG08_033575 [Elysia crispata]|uniref:Uncharacterized protein n=1 Tax=Elysia crispata TaxID=231223 RepID=A0AAE1CJE7_9GAST|nr:hypothetical protein RRG08_033575 [Elysia crispata]
MKSVGTNHVIEYHVSMFDVRNRDPQSAQGANSQSTIVLGTPLQKQQLKPIAIHLSRSRMLRLGRVGGLGSEMSGPSGPCGPSGDLHPYLTSQPTAKRAAGRTRPHH